MNTWTFSFLLGGASSYTCLLIGCCCVVRFEISIVFLFGNLSILFMLTYITILKFSVCLKIYMSKMKHYSICEYKLQNGCWAGINIVIFNAGESDTSEMGFCKCWSVIWVKIHDQWMKCCDQNQVRIWQSNSYPINNTSAMTKLRVLVLSFPDFKDISSKLAGPKWTSTQQDTMKDE
jgi:hypothetical protein